jgi:hypothetical protein
MTIALAYKEFREILAIAALGLAALLVVASSSMGFNPIPFLSGRYSRGIPFINDPFTSRYMICAGSLAMALGFWQSIGDFRGDTQLFLLHRPASRRSVYLTKLGIGLAINLVCGVLPIALYAAWAATPGTHASPFLWSMTAFNWLSWLAMTAIYLGAFLAGIRPAAWLGTRLAPLAASLMAVLSICSVVPIVSGIMLVGVLNTAIIAAILLVIETRDFT